MATSLAPDTTHEEWADAIAGRRREPLLTRAESLWTILGLGLLGAFLLFVVNAHPVATFIASR